MQYCPHCSESLPKSVQVCPRCKKTVDFSILASQFENHKTSHKDKTALRKIWFKEHQNKFNLLGGIIIGFIIGIAAYYIFSLYQVENERTEYIKKITALESEIRKKESAAGDERNNLQKQIIEQREIISILEDQKKRLASIINFTRSITDNCIITPNSPESVGEFQKNIRYLKNLFYDQEEKLKQTSHDTNNSYNLNTISQLLEE